MQNYYHIRCDTETPYEEGLDLPEATAKQRKGRARLVSRPNFIELCRKLTEIDEGMPAAEWGEDRLIPKIEDPRGHARGKKAPGGYICKVDPEGVHWELLCWGFRNTYDVTVFPDNGQLPPCGCKTSRSLSTRSRRSACRHGASTRASRDASC